MRMRVAQSRALPVANLRGRLYRSPFLGVRVDMRSGVPDVYIDDESGRGS